MSENINIGDYIKAQLEKKRISMRSLSKQTNINVSTISRIINHQRKPTNQHLMEISKALDIPFEKLLHQTGLPVKTADDETSDMHASIEMIDAFLKQSDEHYTPFSIDEVKKKLQDYEEEAETEAGRQQIISTFKEKKKSIGDQGAYMKQISSFFHRFFHKKGTKKELVLMGAALIYFINTADVIPDYLFPIGYLDDAVAVQVVMGLLANKY